MIDCGKNQLTQSQEPFQNMKHFSHKVFLPSVAGAFQYKFPKFVQIDIEYVVIAVIEESQFPSVRTASSFGILCRILTSWITAAATASTSLRKTNR